MSDELSRRRGIVGWSVFFLIFVVLTALTQIGGIVYIVSSILVALVLGDRDRNRIVRWFVHLCVFSAIYLAVTLVAMPPIAREFDRYPLPCFASKARPYGALNPGFCLLNRHYAVMGVHRMLDGLARALNKAHPGTVVVYLDAGFPMLDGFPVPPHLSHDSGSNIDIALFYRDKRGKYLPGRARSPIGYLGYEQPRAGDPDPCRGKPYLWVTRWQLGFVQDLWPSRPLEPTRTAAMVRWLAEDGRKFGVEKLFLEPYLVKRLAVPASPLIRFQGCRTARHDDHVHVQIQSGR